MFNFYLLLINLFITNIYTEDKNSKFCDISDPKVSRAFIIQNNIYFGDEKSLWKLNVNDFEISDKETIQRNFGETIKFKAIHSALHFGAIPCDKDDGTTYCAETKKAYDVVLVFGTIGDIDTQFGYKAYKAILNGYPSPIEVDGQMPWQLTREATLTGKFWLPNVKRYKYRAFTFDETKATVYIVAVLNKKSNIYYKTPDTNGRFGTEYKELESPNTYDGLVDWKGKVYGLANNKFYLLSLEGKVAEREEFTLKTFFNCDENSPLKDQIVVQFQLANTSTDDPISGANVTTNDTTESTDTTVSIDTTVDTTGQPVDSTTESATAISLTESVTTSTTTQRSEESRLGSAVWCLIFASIVIAILVIIICWHFNRKKLKAKDAEGGHSEQPKAGSETAAPTPGSKVDTKTDDKPTSKVGSSIESKGSTLLAGPGSKSKSKSSLDSKTGSKLGSKQGSNSSLGGLGSTAGSVTSVRSKTE